jgi:phenylalanyl-tRNA synthetase beta chain
MDISAKDIAAALTSLGFTCHPGGEAVTVTAPYWRSDIGRTVDLIEEVARIIGYENIPATLLKDPIPSHIPDPAPVITRDIRRTLAGYGFQEIMTYTMTGQEALSKLSPAPDAPEGALLRVLNPMTADQEYLRPTLRANILAALAANRRHEEEGIRLFELGKVYRPAEGLPDESEVLCGILSGARVAKTWLGGDGVCDFYDAKGITEALLRHLGVTARFEKSDDTLLHPARQADIVAEDGDTKVSLGVIGELHPGITDTFEISGAVAMFEININALLPFVKGHRIYQPVPRFPSTYRDLALVVDADVSHQSILDIIRDFSIVSEVRLFDVYAGQQVAEGKKSLAYRLVYQSPTHTLTDAEVNQIQAQICRRLTDRLGAVLRG